MALLLGFSHTSQDIWCGVLGSVFGGGNHGDDYFTGQLALKMLKHIFRKEPIWLTHQHPTNLRKKNGTNPRSREKGRTYGCVNLCRFVDRMDSMI